MRYATRTLLLLLPCLAGGGLAPAPLQKPAGQTNYVVAGHPDLKLSSEPEFARNQICRIYLKEQNSWSDTVPARPYGRKPNSPAQRAFEKQVLRMGGAELARHWLRIKSTRGMSPPKAVRSERLMVSYLKRYKGAIGILPKAVAEKQGLSLLLALKAE